MKAQQKQPNILFIAIDDLRPQLNAYGLNHMITPNLDALAAKGRLFKNHFAQVPTCGPSRAVMLTGQNLKSKKEIYHPYLGNKLANQPETENPETFIHHLKQNGYYTVGMGKISHSISGKRKKAYELPYSWDTFISNKDGYQMYASGAKRNKKVTPPFEMLKVSDETYPDGRLAQLAIKELEKRATSDKPFFMAVGFLRPHLPFSAPKKYWDLYNRKEIPLSPNPDAPKDVADEFLHPSSEFFGQYYSPEKGGVRKRISDAYAKKVIHANFASVSYVDAQVGKVLNKLKELGLDKNTIVVVWGDHGWHLGDQTIWGKHSAFENALKSTMIVKTHKMKKAGKATESLIATVDVYPTICELAGVSKPVGLDGKSFVSILNNPKKKTRDAVLSYWRDVVSLRTDRYRFAVYNDGKSQEMMLFDHQKDPNETENIATKHPEVITNLLPLLKKMNKGYLPDLK
ncbi:arylsulfatase A-like enzyme [Wenyingzhuangia heitensis]|uniref:Arylsulfatase A-like enzyme n=1 Tax=Wenyingzhuangia heitensis TaxID=1487859 RepID=A0ABX0UAS3_9FLAO|nr:sulfatase [Wenyingzhuangia heitensis]NIJ45922.1 arylsulfatase A-like enzyme [Wenyingzhuangia heitensis]